MAAALIVARTTVRRVVLLIENLIRLSVAIVVLVVTNLGGRTDLLMAGYATALTGHHACSTLAHTGPQTRIGVLAAADWLRIARMVPDHGIRVFVGLAVTIVVNAVAAILGHGATMRLSVRVWIGAGFTLVAGRRVRLVATYRSFGQADHALTTVVRAPVLIHVPALASLQHAVALLTGANTSKKGTGLVTPTAVIGVVVQVKILVGLAVTVIVHLVTNFLAVVRDMTGILAAGVRIVIHVPMAGHTVANLTLAAHAQAKRMIVLADRVTGSTVMRIALQVESVVDDPVAVVVLPVTDLLGRDAGIGTCVHHRSVHSNSRIGKLPMAFVARMIGIDLTPEQAHGSGHNQ